MYFNINDYFDDIINSYNYAQVNLYYPEKIDNYVSQILSDPKIESATFKFIASFPKESIYDINHYLALRFVYAYSTFRADDTFFYHDSNCRCEKKYRDYAEQYISYLSNFSMVLKNRYKIDDDCFDYVTWCIFNHFVLKKGSEKWIESCVTGRLKDDNLEDYLSKCFADGMISIDDKESVALFFFYIWNIYSIRNELIACRVFPRFNAINPVIKLLEKVTKKRNALVLENNLFYENTDNSKHIRYTIDDIDLMTGTEFEEFLKKLFVSMGYSSYTTKASGDQGIDVIAEKNGIKYGIQAKCYSGSVGNSAIQEAVAGKQYYNCNKAIVVTNQKFTKSAIELAKTTGVILWDRFVLSEKLIYIN